MRITHDVSVNLKRRARIGVAKLSLDDFWRCSGVEEQCCVSVSECVKATPRNAESVQQGPKVVLHDFVGGRRAPVASYKQEALWIWFPLCPVEFQNFNERIRDRKNGFTGLTLGGLDLSVPRRSPDMQ